MRVLSDRFFSKGGELFDKQGKFDSLKITVFANRAGKWVSSIQSSGLHHKKEGCRWSKKRSPGFQLCWCFNCSIPFTFSNPDHQGSSPNISQTQKSHNFPLLKSSLFFSDWCFLPPFFLSAKYLFFLQADLTDMILKSFTLKRLGSERRQLCVAMIQKQICTRMRPFQWSSGACSDWCM